jgi:iron complex outermembrane receptor protein
LRFNFSGGWEDTTLAKGDQAIDLMDRTAGNPNWFVVRPFVNEASNCIFPTYVAQWINNGSPEGIGSLVASYCAIAYDLHLDPLTGLPYKSNPTVSVFSSNPVPPGYQGFDPTTAPNNGAGISKNIGGNSLPNAPPYTVSLGAQYTVPLTPNWAGTLRSDFYWRMLRGGVCSTICLMTGCTVTTPSI